MAVIGNSQTITKYSIGTGADGEKTAAQCAEIRFPKDVYYETEITTEGEMKKT